MKKNRFLVLPAIMVLSLGIAVLAQNEATQVTVTEHEQYGEFITDGDGSTLYLFVKVGEELEEAYDSPMSEGVREAAATCTDECLSAWPAFTVEGALEASGGVDSELLYTESVDGRTQVVYNGWPLFYFAQDSAPGQVNGQGIESFGGEWYVLGPDGWRVERNEDDGM